MDVQSTQYLYFVFTSSASRAKQIFRWKLFLAFLSIEQFHLQWVVLISCKRTSYVIIFVGLGNKHIWGRWGGSDSFLHTYIYLRLHLRWVVLQGRVWQWCGDQNKNLHIEFLIHLHKAFITRFSSCMIDKIKTVLL